MLCACITGDLEAIEALLARDPNLAVCSYEHLTPMRFAVRENQQAVVELLMLRGVDPARDPGDLLALALDRGHAGLAARIELILRTRYRMGPESEAVAGAIRDRDIARMRPWLDRQPGWCTRPTRAATSPSTGRR